MNNTAENIKQEILNLSYWEHFKASQDMHRSLGAEHPRALELQKEANHILAAIKETNERENRK